MFISLLIYSSQKYKMTLQLFIIISIAVTISRVVVDF